MRTFIKEKYPLLQMKDEKHLHHASIAALQTISEATLSIIAASRSASASDFPSE